MTLNALCSAAQCKLHISVKYPYKQNNKDFNVHICYSKPNSPYYPTQNILMNKNMPII